MKRPRLESRVTAFILRGVEIGSSAVRGFYIIFFGGKVHECKKIGQY